MMHFEFNVAPSVATLRKHIRTADASGETLVIFDRGEQQSRFEKHDGRWYHSGNGLLKAGYKLEEVLNHEAQQGRQERSYSLSF